MTDEITLTIPRDADFHRVAHLVLGGLAVRMDLTVENLEDMQIALDSLLGLSELEPGDITVRMALRDGALEACVGPLPASVLENGLWCFEIYSSAKRDRGVGAGRFCLIIKARKRAGAGRPRSINGTMCTFGQASAERFT